MNDNRKYFILTFWPIPMMVLFTAGAIYYGLDVKIITPVQIGIVAAGFIGVVWASLLDARRARTARLRELRQAAKPVVLHENWCPHPKTATCLCGKEPFYSPTNRRARGEIE